MSGYRILWVDDDSEVLESVERLVRDEGWILVAAQNSSQAKELLQQDSFAVLAVDQQLLDGTGVDLLEYACLKSPASSRLLVTGDVSTGVIEDAVNRGHVFRFISKPWQNDLVLHEVRKAIEYHQLKITQTTLLKEVTLQNRKLEQLTSGLEQLVAERTLTAEASKTQAERQLSHVRELVRFIKDLSLLTSVEELMGLIQKELKGFHELRAPVLGYIAAERRPMISFFQGKQVVERGARQMWSQRSRMRNNEHEDRVYLANEFGRPFVKVLAIPLKRRGRASEVESEPPATLFFEHTLNETKIDGFLSFISERLQPLSIALDRILLEYSLKSTSIQWENTFDGIKDPIAIIDIDYDVVRANRHFHTNNGARLYENSCHKIFFGLESPCRGCPMEVALRSGQPQKGQVKLGARVFEVLSYPIRLHGDSIATNVINHYVDVTSARELHSRMIQSEKMAAIGHLAGNIAHELNNPLTGIRSLAQVLLTELPEEGTIKEDVHEVERAAGRSEKIIENLLNFSKGDSDERAVHISLNEIVERTLPMLKTAMREHRSEIYLSETEAEVRAEPHLLQQVVFNLVNNACQAMKDRGTITIQTEVVSDADEKRWFILQVADTGVGIPPEIIDNIFEPFFTTKERGQGTGLGLSMSQSVVQKFGGDIAVKSVLGEGTVFTIRLPVVSEVGS